MGRRRVQAAGSSPRQSEPGSQPELAWPAAVRSRAAKGAAAVAARDAVEMPWAAAVAVVAAVRLASGAAGPQRGSALAPALAAVEVAAVRASSRAPSACAMPS